MDVEEEELLMLQVRERTVHSGGPLGFLVEFTYLWVLFCRLR